MTIVAVCLLFLLILGVLEAECHRRNLLKIPVRILVNGTRGKTSVTRLIAAAFNEAGLLTYAKTTGSDAVWIMPDGTQQHYRSGRMPNIIEQVPFVRMAKRGNAHAIVVECMALRPENQEMTGEILVCPHYTIITNAYVDHIDEIGKNEEETVETLALSVWSKGIAVTDDRRFAQKVPHILFPDEQVPLPPKSAFSYPVYEDNLRLVHVITKAMGIPWDTAVRGMMKTQPDIGMCGPFQLGNCLVINAFAANDPSSFEKVQAAAPLRTGPLYLLYNHRADRGFRLKAFLPSISRLLTQCTGLAVIGENKKLVARYLGQRTGLASFEVKNAFAWLETLDKEQSTVICFGNIKGEGLALIDTLLKRRDGLA